jgi:hypothetical protein
MINVAIITTIHHNIGDDFVREGILYLLERAIGPVQPRLIHKHIPLTVRPEWEWFYRSGLSRFLDRVPRLSGARIAREIDRLPVQSQTDKILTCDLLVQSGAPVYWLRQSSSCAENEWFAPLVTRRWMTVRERVPLLNLAGGACQQYHSNGQEFLGAERTLAYIRDFYHLCALTTVRDELSRTILGMIGIEPLTLPCPSLFASTRLQIAPQPPSYIALNYMPGGGHFRADQHIDADAWQRTFTRFVTTLARQEACLLVCHNHEEFRLARNLFPDVPAYYSPDYADYLAVYAKARYGILNRVHGAYALASFGRPSVVVGADSRARMVDLIGLRHLFVEDASEDRLEQERAILETERATFAGTIGDCQEQVEAAYIHAIQKALNRI